MKKSTVLQALAALVIIAVAVALSMALSSKKPRARKAPPVPAIPLVQTLTLAPEPHTLTIEAFGEVSPARTVDLFPEVSGKVTAVHSEFIPGGVIPQGETVVSIDPEDYALAIETQKAAVADAEYELTLEQAQQNIARKTWNFTNDANDVNRSIALREPHIKRIKARLAAARSALEAAQLDLARTALAAPFNALVIETLSFTGQLATPSKPVATLASADVFHVNVPVALPDLPLLHFADDATGRRGSPARVIHERSAQNTVERTAEVYKLHATLSDGGSRARVILRIKDPLQLNAGRSSRIADRLLPGSFVRVVIEAGTIENAYSIPRTALRPNNTVWILRPDETLDIRTVEIDRARHADVLVSEGIAPGERLITSRLQAPLQGMALRTGNSAPGDKAGKEGNGAGGPRKSPEENAR